MPKNYKKKQFRTKQLPQTTRRLDQKQNKAITNLNKKVKKIQVEEEVKHIDILYAEISALAASPYPWFSHNFTPVGASNITRLGNVIAPTSYQIRFRIRQDIDRTGEASRVRMIIFWDTQVNGAAATYLGATGVLDNTVITDQLAAPRNYDTIDRYHIIKDKTYVLQNTMATVEVAGAVSKVSRAIIQKTFIIKASRRIKYTGATGTIADIANNALYIVFYSDAVSEPPTIDGGVRMYFKDT